MSILLTNALTRTFGNFKAVDNLNMHVEPGEIVALLGPNGAGKSTAIKMLTTLLPPSSGEAFIKNFNLKTQPNQIRKIIGYVPQMLSADGSLTGYENLLLFAKLYDIPAKERNKRVNELLEFMNLKDSMHKLVREYSGGMIRRLEIAQSTLHRPALLFLDEPTTGLDPIGRNVVWEHIKALQREFSTTIVLTTHLMEEADAICHKISLMARGKLVVTGTPEELKKSIPKENATLEDVFIHYTTDQLNESGSNYRNVAIERKTNRRLG
jgi:ABC-2 type transport system ATP-binding protein